MLGPPQHAKVQLSSVGQHIPVKFKMAHSILSTQSAEAKTGAAVEGKSEVNEEGKSEMKLDGTLDGTSEVKSDETLDGTFDAKSPF
jgi:hypothetical protein